ncbi:hypothetical protein K2173_022453 [Erythroxylum novogranatense]|uniref:J domain-containing protein n=1 Tax=Erythroxylum novogranatense TaxID=1862640 RepID=A0AAV8TKB6_9ROSI|nr:hypothetical protein K2173_022453 [Erythroxylum novogranatense]
MDCNREEAIRAKGIAESKMQSKDFVSARRFALKAQQLYKDLDNISQILMVCDVHCAAEKKLFGNEMDWYGILQIEQTADEALIKKQYRKFALQLHPDKNRFPGAEAAFKLIGEAQRVLLDKGKRSLHDIKRKASMNKTIPPLKQPQKATYNTNHVAHNSFGGKFKGINSHHQQPQEGTVQQHPSDRATFWTTCPFCNVNYQYYTEVMNKSLLCRSCNRSFIAYKKISQGPTETNSNQAAFVHRKDVPYQGACKVDLGNRGTAFAEHLKNAFSQKQSCNREFNSGTERKDIPCQSSIQGMSNGECLKRAFSQKQGCNAEFNIGTESGKKRRKIETESSEKCDFKAKVRSDSHGGSPRRSGRRKQPVSYNENAGGDEEFTSHPKKARGTGSSCAIDEQKDNELKGDVSETNKQSSEGANCKDESEVKQVKHQESSLDGVKTRNVNHEKVEGNVWKESSGAHVSLTSDSSSKSKSETSTCAYDEPDFNDFEKHRNEECFSAGQIWALYDSVDAMPRFYALIRKVFSPGFKVRITWLESAPDEKTEIEGVNEVLPVGCGKYVLGGSEYSNKRLMFSHVIPWEKGKPKDPYKIYPRQGQTWALFKNRDAKWKSDADSNRKYDYEFVEVLSDYSDDVGVCVAFLHKLKGFVSVFCRVGEQSFQIPSAKLSRFSHMVPSFKLTGKEVECGSKSFELDPASLPKNIIEIALSEDLGAGVADGVPIDSSSKPYNKVNCEKELEGRNSTPMAESAGTKESQLGHNSNDINNGDVIEVPDAEFFDFDAEKSIDKIKVGQIWALYSAEDGLPKYYGLISKIDSAQGCTIHVRWLTSCASKDIPRWNDKNMLVCCGRFRFENRAGMLINLLNSFHIR